MSIYQESVLVFQKQYIVQDVSHFPSKCNFLKGNKVLLLDIDNNASASILFNGVKHWIPVRSLITIPEYKAKAVQAIKADGFAVTAKNTLGFAVGTAYLSPYGITNTSFKVDMNGKTFVIPLEIVCSLVRSGRAIKKAVIKDVSIKTGFNEVFVEAVGELVAPAKNRDDILEVPSALIKLLPGINLVALRDDILKGIYNDPEIKYWDMDGNFWDTIAEVEVSNKKIKHKLLTKVLIEKASDDLTYQGQLIRNNI